MDLRAVYNGKKVFVTGHTGFKGTWLITWLSQLGAIVKGYSLSPEPNSFYEAIKGDELCESTIADIRDKDLIKSEILAFEPDFIFHLAAQPLVRLSYDIPVDTFDINVIGTANLLDALRYLIKPCVAVIITTDKVYQNLEIEYAYKETDKLGGYDPYSASKAAAEIVIDSYKSSFFNPSNYLIHNKSISSARAGNVIGGGDWSKDRIIPDIVRALLKGDSIPVRNPNSVRPWQHVLEPLNGYLVLAARQFYSPREFAQSFNLGPHTSDVLRVEELVKIAIDAWGAGSYHFPSNVDERHEAGLLQLDIDKALETLNWQPKLNAKEAIYLTIAWYKKASSCDIRDLTLHQIEDFLKKDVRI